MKTQGRRLQDAQEESVKLADTLALLRASQGDVAMLTAELERERARGEFAEAEARDLRDQQRRDGAATGVTSSSSSSSSSSSPSLPTPISAPQNPIPLQLDNENLRAQLARHQQREAEMRAELSDQADRIRLLEAQVRVSALSVSDEKREEMAAYMADYDDFVLALKHQNGSSANVNDNKNKNNSNDNNNSSGTNTDRPQGRQQRSAEEEQEQGRERRRVTLEGGKENDDWLRAKKEKAQKRN